MSAWKLTESKRSPGVWVLIGPYDPDFLDDLKAAVPPDARTWDPVLKGWRIRGEVAVAAARRVVEMYEDNAQAGDDGDDATRGYDE
jgi:hypothetical protein